MLAIIVLMLALFAKFIVPQGYMVASDGYRMLTVQICFDGRTHKTVTLAVPMDGQHRSGDQDQRAKGDAKCPFSALSMSALGGADAALLAIAFAFILAAGFAAVIPAQPRRIHHLRPPLRGPPALA